MAMNRDFLSMPFEEGAAANTGPQLNLWRKLITSLIILPMECTFTQGRHYFVNLSLIVHIEITGPKQLGE
jgi:hypothetical protein